MTLPTHWYNILADVDFELPPDLPVPGVEGDLTLQVPLSLVRQENATRAAVPIPEPVRERYAAWRTTPLRRAHVLERELGTSSRIFYKYEGDNPTGSHKLNTAVAQAYYYARTGTRCLTVGTGAGQWGTAVAAASRMFGIRCRVYMVRTSLQKKPHRRTMMEMLGAEVIASPSERTPTGRAALARGEHGGSLSVALGEAMDDAGGDGVRFCAGSGETYSILHSTVIGNEALAQVEELDAHPDVVVAGLGAGSNFGGLAFPFLGRALTGAGPAVRCVSAEPAACPKLTRGRYAYDHTDSSGKSPLQRMYTLGSHFAPTGMHAGGLRYHGTGKIISALYDRSMIEARAFAQRDVFASAVAFARAEGLVPAPESAHAVHGAIEEVRAADRDGERRTVLVSLSGHGLFDMSAYEAYLAGDMVDVVVTDEEIEASLSLLPETSRPAVPA